MPSFETGSVKIIQGWVTASEDSSIEGSFSKQLSDFYSTVGIASSSGIVEDVSYVNHGNWLTAIITISGSLPA